VREFGFETIAVVVHGFDAWRCDFWLRVCLNDVCVVCCSNDADTVALNCLWLSVCVCVCWPVVALLDICFILLVCWGGFVAVDCGKRTLDLCRA